MGVETNQISIPNYKDLEIVGTGRTSLAYSFSGHANTGGTDIASTLVSHNLGYAPLLLMTVDSGGGSYETVSSGSVSTMDSGQYFTQTLWHKFVVADTFMMIYYFNSYHDHGTGTSAYSGTNNYIYYFLRQRVV